MVAARIVEWLTVNATLHFLGYGFAGAGALSRTRRENGHSPYSRIPGIRCRSWPTLVCRRHCKASSGQPIPGYQPPAPQQPMGTTLNATQQQPNVPQYIQTQGGTISGGAASQMRDAGRQKWVPGPNRFKNPAYSACHNAEAPQRGNTPAKSG